MARCSNCNNGKVPCECGGQDKNCFVCHGTGYRDCWSCGGTGQVPDDPRQCTFLACAIAFLIVVLFFSAIGQNVAQAETTSTPTPTLTPTPKKDVTTPTPVAGLNVAIEPNFPIICVLAPDSCNDLQVSIRSSNAAVSSGQYVTVTFTVTNTGVNTATVDTSMLRPDGTVWNRVDLFRPNQTWRYQSRVTMTETFTFTVTSISNIRELRPGDESASVTVMFLQENPIKWESFFPLITSGMRPPDEGEPLN